eukprot:Em0053g22a
MDSNEENQEAIDSMHVFEAERGDDMYTSGASDDASELSRPVSENDSDSEEEYSHSSSSEQEEEPMSCTLNMESIPESSFEPLYNGSTVTVCGAYFCIMKTYLPKYVLKVRTLFYVAFGRDQENQT